MWPDMTDPSADPPQTVAVATALRPIFDQFLVIQQRHLAALEQALADDDRVALARLAHTVRGACATYQLPAAAQLARTLENSLHHDDPAAIGRLIAGLKRYFENITIEFRDTGTTATPAIAPAPKRP